MSCEINGIGGDREDGMAAGRSDISCLSRGILKRLFLPVYWPKARGINGVERKYEAKTY